MSKLGRICVLPLLLAGCADTVTRAQLTDVQRRLDVEQRRSAAAEHKIDELENRVFLLTDQVESQKIAAIHRTRQTQTLPVVTLKPEAPASSAAPASDEITYDSNGDEIVFEGEAKSPDPSHTVLRIDGTKLASRRSGRAEPTAELRAERAPLPAPSNEDNLGVAPVPPIRGSAPVVEHAPPAAEPLALYKSAYDDLRAGKHEAAERGFREFVKKYPHHDYADNAQYWLGECFYDQRAFDKAAPEFRAVVTRWPTGNKAPDAMLKLGFSLLALGDVDRGRTTLRAVDTTYPRTEAARLASERLAQLGASTTEGSK